MKLMLHSKANVYAVEINRITFGQCEDILDAIDIDSMEFKNGDELENCINSILKDRISKIHPVITSIFCIPDEEFATVKIEELVDVLTFITSYALNELSQYASNSDTEKGAILLPFIKFYLICR